MVLYIANVDLLIKYILLATAEDGDFTDISTFLTFPSGSSDGEERCSPLLALSDYFVELEEIFVVTLTLETINETSFITGNTEASISIIDSNCTYVTSFEALSLYVLCTLHVLSAAVFDLPIMSTVINEDNSTLSMCTAMTTNPPGSILAMNVTVLLSTLDGSGTYIGIVAMILK